MRPSSLGINTFISEGCHRDVRVAAAKPLVVEYEPEYGYEEDEGGEDGAN